MIISIFKKKFINYIYIQKVIKKNNLLNTDYYYLIIQTNFQYIYFLPHLFYFIDNSLNYVNPRLISILIL